MKREKVLSGLLTAAMCLSLLAGCGGGNQDSKPSDNQGGNSQQEEGNSGEINFDEEPYEIVLENLTLGEDIPDLEKIEEAVNEISVPAINCKLKILNIHIGDHVTKMSLMATGGEKVDIVTAGRTYAYPNMVADGLLLPLNDLLEERGQGIMEKGAMALEGNKIDGKIYAVPGELYVYGSTGIIYNKDMADKYNITVPKMPTAEDIEKIAEQLHEADPNVYFMTKGTGEFDVMYNQFYPNIQVFGQNCMYGAMYKDDPEFKIFNFLKSEEYKEYLHKNRDWYEKGWVPSDSMVSGINARDVFKMQQSFCEFGTTSPIQLGNLQSSYDFTLGMENMREPERSTESGRENGWGIFVNCERPDKAMDFLNLMYTNEEVINLLTNGIEGIHYEKVSDRIIKYPEGVNDGNIGYKKDFSNFGDVLMAYYKEPVTEESIDECFAINEAAESSPLLGFSFDTTKVSTQISNVTNAIAEFMPPLVVGIYEHDEIDIQLEKMNQALDAAGIEEIIAEHQRQLDEWRANKDAN
ncbi:MAG: ABC transporter substrate-binding protein [Lachnospiraceae bacterium]|nr:ABC transporter substrate-binding protein [Lachnospiraceae bacterium]